MDIGVLLRALWPYLAALYVLDCVLLVRGGHLLFTGTPAGGFRLKGAGLRLAGLLPWSWSVLSLKDPPVLSENGLYVRSAALHEDPRPHRPGDFELIPFDEVRSVGRNGQKIIMNGKAICQAPSGMAAAYLVQKIKELLAAPAWQRSLIVKAFMEEAHDPDMARAALERARELTPKLAWASFVMMVLLGLVLPMSIIFPSSPSRLWVLMGVILAVYLLVLALWWRTHRVLWPREVNDRVEELVVLLFFPVSAMHILGKLTRRLLVNFDSTVVSAVLASEEAKGLLKRECLRMRITMGSGWEPDLQKIWEARLALLENLAGKVGVDPRHLELWNRGAQEGQGTVCPMCLATYREGIEECADCSVLLMPKEALVQIVGTGC